MTLSHPLGRNLEHDPLSWNYRIARKIVVRRNVTHRVGPHLNQGNTSACEGNTAAEWLNWTKAGANRRHYVRANQNSISHLKESDAVSLYSKATYLDNDEIPGHYPPEDTGTSGNGIAKAMRAALAIEKWSWTFDFESFLTTLQQQPIMLGLNWSNSMFEVDSKGFVHLDRDIVGGHAVLAHAVDFRQERVGCTNHWVNDDGTPWGVTIGGHPGSFWFKMNDLEDLLINQRGDSLVPVLGAT